MTKFCCVNHLNKTERVSLCIVAGCARETSIHHDLEAIVRSMDVGFVMVRGDMYVAVLLYAIWA